LLLETNAAGDFKLKSLLIYHSKNSKALKDVNKKQLSIIWKSNKREWETKNLFQNWFKNPSRYDRLF